jgi:hypothetical protein
MGKQLVNNPQALLQLLVRQILISQAESWLSRFVSFAPSPELVASKAQE